MTSVHLRPGRRTNPVEKMYAAWPALLYLNASLCGPMLAPLLESQDARVDQAYASPDLGWVLRYHQGVLC